MVKRLSGSFFAVGIEWFVNMLGLQKDKVFYSECGLGQPNKGQV